MFYSQKYLSTMPFKHKTQNPSKDAKVIKKNCKVKTDESSSWKDKDSKTGKINTGKTDISDNEEKKVCPHVNFEYFSPDLVDEKNDNNNPVHPNIHLNQLL